MSKSLQNIFLTLTLSVLVLANSYAQGTTVQKNAIELCKAVNSSNFYSKTNLITIQNYFKNTYFPNIVVSGADDLQFRKYVSRYQFAFGLIQTGKLNTQTVQYIRNSQKCYDIEREIINFEKNPPQKKISQSEVLYNLIKTFLVSRLKLDKSRMLSEFLLQQVLTVSSHRLITKLLFKITLLQLVLHKAQILALQMLNLKILRTWEMMKMKC